MKNLILFDFSSFLCLFATNKRHLSTYHRTPSGRHKGLEHMRPMLAKFPHSCLFGICKAASLAAPCKNNCTKIFRCIGSASSKRANFLQEKAKAELIVCLLTSILTHYCGKFAFLNRMGFKSLMPNALSAHRQGQLRALMILWVERLWKLI